MNWHSFIFFDTKVHRLRRHFVFWLAWWLYFTISYYHYEQVGLQETVFESFSFPFIIKSLLLLSIHVSACYIFIDYLMPRFFFMKKYAGFAAGTLTLCVFILLAGFVFHTIVFTLVDSAFQYQPTINNKNAWWTSITSGLLSAPKVITAAVAIKLIKRWWYKQKEKELFEKEKLIAELQLLKTQIHPEILFGTLNEISNLTQKKDVAKASVLLLKLADILSYMLYECNDKFVPLEKEIKAIKDYLLLEKTMLGDLFEMDISVKGQTDNKMIAPLILFSFIENSFLYMNDKQLETSWINLEFHVEKSELVMKLIHGKTNDLLDSPENKREIDNTLKRLDFFYHNRYEFKTTADAEMMMTYLKFFLEESVNGNQQLINNKQKEYAFG